MKNKFWMAIVLCLVLQSVCAQEVNNCSTVSDYDGNVYQTVKIGEQCWMRENLRTTHYADGKPLQLGTHVSETERSYFYPGNAVQNVARYGLLYSWFTALNGAAPSEKIPSGVQGICPKGWHLPSNFEWMGMEDFLGSHDAYRCGTDVNNVTKALAATDGWHYDFATKGQPCSIIEEMSSNNTSGFTALPAGNYNENYQGFGTECGFWTASEGSDVSSPIHRLYRANAMVEINCTPKEAAYSVRCVKDAE